MSKILHKPTKSMEKMDSPAHSSSSPIPIPPGRVPPSHDSPTSTTPLQNTPLGYSEGDAELVLTAANLIETKYGRTLLHAGSTDADRAAAAARIMGALLQRDQNDEDCLKTARAIIDHVHGHGTATGAFGEGSLMIFPMGAEIESREWERIGNEWEHRLHQFMSEMKILELAEIGRDLVTQFGGVEVELKIGETARQREKREEEEEERRRFELTRSLYLRAREAGIAKKNDGNDDTAMS